MLSAENTKGASVAVATTDAFHTYRVVVDTTTHAIEVFRDDVSVLTTSAILEIDGNAERDILFGEGSIAATGVSEWRSMKHNAATLGPCP